MRLVRFFAEYKYFFIRGWLYFSILPAIIIFILGLRSFYGTIAELGVPMQLLYVLITIGVIIGPVLIGIVDYKYIARVEQQRNWVITEGAADLNRKVDAIYNVLVGDDGK